MAVVQKRSVLAPPESTATARLVFEAARRADAMGLLEASDVGQFDSAAARHVAARAHAAGIGRTSAAQLSNVEAPAPAEVDSMLKALIAALEQSPVPQFEWRSVSRVFEPEQLADLLDISLSSLRRYQGGERTTPDDVAARLHFLALVIGDLAGGYNEIGIRRWFQRKRTQLDGRSPAAMLGRNWDPDDAGPQRVRALAAALVSLAGA
jgi:hypothetical protein